MTRERATTTDRVRAALAAEPRTREVPMFGGLSFMVDDKMLVSAMPDGALLVRSDPRRHRELVVLPGASQAEMGAGRSMGPSWIRVADDAVATDEGLSFWLGVAWEHHPHAQASTR